MGKETTARRVGVSAPEVGGVAAGRGAAIAPTACGLGAQIVVSRPRIRDAHTMLASGVIGAAVALRVALALRGWPDIDSDLAVVGLMGRHILYHGAAPVFYYGQSYNGPLDAYFAAAFFAVLGPTNLALNLSALPLLALFLGGTYALGRAAFGPVPALLALVYLALGPAFALLMGSHYPVFGVVDGLGVLLLCLAYLRIRAPAAPAAGLAADARRLAHYAAIGVVAGLGIWSAQLVLPFVVVALLALAFARPRELFRVPGLALLGGVAIGCWPLLAYNLQHNGITFTELAHAGSLAPGAARAVPIVLVLVLQFAMVLSAGLPAVFGSPRVCLPASDAPGSYPPALAVLGSRPDLACSGLNLAFSLAIMLCYIVAARAVVRAIVRAYDRAHLPRRRALAPTDGSTTGERTRTAPDISSDQARLWPRGMLLAVAVLTVALDLTSTTAAFLPLAAARYLLPLYASVPIVFGVLWERAAPAARLAVSASTHGARAVRARGARPLVAKSHAARRVVRTPLGASSARLLRGVLASAAIVMLLAFAGYGAASSADYAATSRQFGVAASPADQRLLAALQAHGITRFLASYWICYRLVFESGEQAVCADHEAEGALFATRPGYNRYWPYVILLRQTAYPAYIFLAGSPEDTGFVSDAAAYGWPHAGYVRFSVAGYAVYYRPTGSD